MSKRKERPDFSSRLNTRFPEFDAAWNNLMREVGPDLVNFIKEKITGQSYLKDLAKFKFKVVVDNNFVFGQIKGVVEKKKNIEQSLIYKLVSSRIVQVFAPPKLQEELTNKINTLISEDNQEKALGYAFTILSRIEVKDAQWTEDWKKASRLIGEVDSDDVPYLAIALEIESHAIMTFDEVFHRQGEIKVWKHGDADKAITNFNSGFISLLIIDRAGNFIGNILSIIFRFIRDLIAELVEFLILIATGAIKTLTKIPWPFWFLIIGLGIILWDDISKVGKDIFSFIKEKGNEVIARLKEAVSEIHELLKGFLEVAELTGTIALEFLGYLLNEYTDLSDQLKDLKFDKTIDFMEGASTKQA